MTNQFGYEIRNRAGNLLAGGGGFGSKSRAMMACYQHIANLAKKAPPDAPGIGTVLLSGETANGPVAWRMDACGRFGRAVK